MGGPATPHSPSPRALPSPPRLAWVRGIRASPFLRGLLGDEGYTGLPRRSPNPKPCLPPPTAKRGQEPGPPPPRFLGGRGTRATAGVLPSPTSKKKLLSCPNNPLQAARGCISQNGRLRGHPKGLFPLPKKWRLRRSLDLCKTPPGKSQKCLGRKKLRHTEVEARSSVEEGGACGARGTWAPGPPHSRPPPHPQALQRVLCCNGLFGPALEHQSPQSLSLPSSLETPAHHSRS